MRHGVILVVDEAEVFEAAAPVLRREFDNDPLIHETSAASAMALVRAHTPLELVIADWEIAGPAFIRAVRADPETHHIPLIVTSRNDADEVIAQAMRLGATDHLAKPFLERGLLAKLRRITRSQERRRLRRVRPPAPCSARVELAGVGHFSWPLIDLSLSGCQLRVPAADAGQLRIYQQAQVEITTEAPLRLSGELIRMTRDHDAQAQESILAAIHFTGQEQDERFTALLDEWREAWQRTEEAP